jgi:hypothetical protein
MIVQLLQLPGFLGEDMTHSIARIAALTLTLMALSASLAVAQSTEKPGGSSAPFHGMQVRDRIIVVDSNVAALNFVFQGEQEGLITGQLVRDDRHTFKQSGEFAPPRGVEGSGCTVPSQF